MTKTVIGLFDTLAEAQAAMDDLTRFGVRREDISVVARGEQRDETREVGSDAAAEGAGAGAVGGTLVGGALGLLVGTGLLVIPGIGPVLAAGPIAAAIGTIGAAAGATALGAGIGAAAGGLLGGLMGAGVPENEAEAYVEGVRRGGTLLSVQVNDVEADDVRELLLRNGAVDMSRRADEWRSGGWGTDNSIDTTAVDDDTSIPRGDSYSISGQRANDDWQESSKLGTATGTAAGAAAGATIGAVGGPVGAAIGGVAGAAAGAGAGAAGDVAGERLEDREANYRFRDDENLNEVDRQVVDTSYTNVDRTGESVKGAGYESGHDQPRAHEPEAFGEWLDEGERAYRTPEDTRNDASTLAATGAGAPATSGTAYRPDGRNTIERNESMGHADTAAEMDGDLMGEGSRRSAQYAGANEMGGAMSNMGPSGPEQPGRAASGDMSDRRRVRIYDRPASGGAAMAASDELPAHGDFARGMRDQAAPAVEPDYARGMHSDATANSDGHSHAAGEDPGAPHHGDFARGMRQGEGQPTAPDYARGQRGFESYDQDFVAHHRSMTGAGGQPYDYYKPGYQFGYDMANDRAYSHESWSAAERDARTSWEREARGSWEEFKDAIRYGWEKARGRA